MSNGARISGFLGGALLGMFVLRSFGGLLAGGAIGVVSAELALLTYRNRTHLKFSIRDLFWLTALVALALGWWLDRREWAEAYSTKSHDSEIWEARAGELQNRAEILSERLSAAPVPASAPAANPSKP